MLSFLKAWSYLDAILKTYDKQFVDAETAEIESDLIQTLVVLNSKSYA